MEMQVFKEPVFDDEPTISFIVPVHAKNLDKNIFKRCLLSLENQDYPKMEVVMVLNGGEDSELEQVAEYFTSKDTRFRLVKSDEPGACNARNLGFEKSTGEIVSFFNSDYKLKPGHARLWVNTLVDNPDCGFLYGGYEYGSYPSFAIASRKFDPFVLTQFNYIDCGFPLWRRYFVPWDSEVKSLQDWDFWLRVIKTHNVKGYFLDRDLSFIAEPPRPGGLSYDSSSHWNERVRFVREKNGIPTSDLLVTSIGAEFHAIQIAKMLGADFRDTSVIQKPNEYKAIYMIGFYIKADVPQNDHVRILASFPKDVKRIVHFVGADIYWLRKFPYESMKILSASMKKTGFIFLSENEQAQKELKDFGIETKIVPISPYNDYEIRPLPDPFRVAIYLTDKSDFDKYLQAHSLSIVKAMPDVEFTGYGDGAKDFRWPNFKHAGNMDNDAYKQFVYDHGAVMRLVRHDTLPMAPCDFLLAGRPVITNIPMRYATVIETSGRVPQNENEVPNDWDIFGPGFSVYRWPATKKQIVQLIRHHKRFAYSANFQDNVMPFEFKSMQERGHDYWTKVLDRQTYINTIFELAGLKKKELALA